MINTVELRVGEEVLMWVQQQKKMEGEEGKWEDEKVDSDADWETCVGWQKYFNLGQRKMKANMSY